MERLDGRVALVTGAASGIGHAIAIRLAQEGAAVVVTDIQDEPGEAVAKGIRETGGRAVFVHHDVVSPAEWERAVGSAAREFGGLDILVNNAGMGDLAVIEETSLEDYERTIAIDQTGVFLGMKTAAALLSASPHASVINISSIFGTSGGFGTSPAYHAAKGAVRTLNKNTAPALGGQGHPSQLRAPRLHRHADSRLDQGHRFRAGDDRVDPDGTLGPSTGDRRGVAYLASDDASFVTGLELYIDGGYMAR
jgi:NAD(P)-dependent dehydrogenase (short-subunit alcohol dehydrogenase family)